MGAIRLLLALSVVAVHVGYRPFLMASGEAAVEAFFLISGFYIALALHGPYRDSRRRFWLNRALRLYPAYFVVAGAALIFSLATTDILDAFQTLPVDARAWLIAVNITLVGQDTVMFLGVQDGTLAFTRDFSATDLQLWRFLLVPPAWSLGVEILFYLLAPALVLLPTRTLIALGSASVAIRLLLAVNGLSADPWSYRFFPSELVYFLSGIVAFRAMQWQRETSPAALRHGTPFMLCAIAGILMQSHFPGPAWARNLSLVLMIGVCLPTLFWSTKDSRLDKFLGDLSYPLYIAHWPVIAWVGVVQAEAVSGTQAAFAGIACVVAAAVLTLLIDRPAQALRQRVRS